MTSTQTRTETWVPEITFAARLALVRQAMGWNIREASRACGISPQSWRGWEIEHRLPHDVLDVIGRIARRTGVSEEWLLRGGPMRRTVNARWMLSRRPPGPTRPPRGVRSADPMHRRPVVRSSTITGVSV